MSTEHPTSHAAGGDSVLADRLRAISGAVRKAPAPPEAVKPATGPTPADHFGRSAYKPPAGYVEVAVPAGTSTATGAPRTRHFRAVEPGRMQRRTMVDAIRRPASEPTR